VSRISVAIISSLVGKTPDTITYSFVFDEAYRLSKRGVKVHIIRSRFENDSISYGMHYHGLRRMVDIRAIELFLHEFHVYPPISLLRNPAKIYWENLYASNISKIVAKNNIDLIHAHFAYPEGFCGLIAKGKETIPLIVTIHGYELNVVPEVKYGLLLSRRYAFIVKKVLEKADLILAVSKDLCRKAKLLSDKSNVIYLPNAVDTELFYPPDSLEEKFAIRRKLFNIEEENIVLINTRHLRPVYDHFTLLAGLAYLRKIDPKMYRRTKLVIVGDGPLRKYIELFAYNLNVSKNLVIIGYQPRRLMPMLMRAADIYVNTSLSEGMPLSILEAMATGLPVISTSVGGILDLIKHEENGFLIPPKDYRKLALSIQRLVKGELMHKMGKLNRYKIVGDFSIEQKLNRLIKIYENVQRCI